MRALNTALDHCNDSVSQERDKKFEWGWLIEEGALELPTWLAHVSKLSQRPLLDEVCSPAWRAKWVNKWTRQEHGRRMEIMLAVARAHDDTLRCEVYPDDAPACAYSVMKQSQDIKEMAENKYASLQWQMPEISAAVRTRQVCDRAPVFFYRALVPKRPVILRSLLIVGTPPYYVKSLLTQSLFFACPDMCQLWRASCVLIVLVAC